MRFTYINLSSQGKCLSWSNNYLVAFDSTFQWPIVHPEPSWFIWPSAPHSSSLESRYWSLLSILNWRADGRTFWLDLKSALRRSLGNSSLANCSQSFNLHWAICNNLEFVSVLCIICVYLCFNYVIVSFTPCYS